MWIKICGIRDVETAMQIAALNPDAIGLNFFAKSPRSVDVETAAKISATISAAIERIGLFVNHSTEEVLDICQQCSISTAQLHGDETPGFLARLKSTRPDLKLFRAFRVDATDGCSEIADYLAKCGQLGVTLDGCLIDSRVEGEYGGTGHTAPWDLLADQYDSRGWPRLILAGGLTSENVAEAIRVTHPWGVDVASGVESSRGVKDVSLVERFIEAARPADV
ncbi:MAG: phosphoribosylanthranilate isomerase [Planctomycetota bacterium]|nr:phosphoribosylanthranilate isomerase [Planctomycetota bacterium]